APAPAQIHCCLLPLMLPATPPTTAPMAAPVQPLPPAMAAMPAPAAAPIAAPLTVPCCCGVMLVHPITPAAAAIVTISPSRFIALSPLPGFQSRDDHFEPDGFDNRSLQLVGIGGVPLVEP